LPQGASLERTLAVVDRWEAATRKVEGVRNILSLSESPFEPDSYRTNRGLLIIRLAPAGAGRPDLAAIAQSVRRIFPTFNEALLRLRDPAVPPLPGGDYSLRLAISSRAADGTERLYSVADELLKRLRENPRLTDVYSEFNGPVPSMSIVLDREKAAALGVSVEQVQKSIQAVVGRRGIEGSPEQLERVRSATVADAHGKSVPLESVVRITNGLSPAVIERLDLAEAIEITANVAPGISIKDGRALCEEAARTALPPEFSLTWLSAQPSPAK
jgi:multidrug efflux pump subunit AcrB